MSNEQFIAKIKREIADAEVISVTRVLHHEWDLDGWVALIKTEGTVKVVTTNHGGIVIGSLTEGRKMMRDQIRETEKIVDEMKTFQGTLRANLGD